MSAGLLGLGLEAVGWVGDRVVMSPTQVRVEMHTTATLSPCPRCGQSSSRIHSRYLRRLADMPVCGKPLRLQVTARRFFCDNPACAQRVFVERLPGLAKRHARRTDRLREAHRRLGLALGGQAGARLARGLGMPASGASLLRQVRQEPLPEVTTPRVLGVDDWALCRGQRYGTILCDLEHHRRLDLLPERSASSLAHWLRDHPGVQVISRDRGEEYRKGASEAAPQAPQVADRWHLIHNLHQTLMRTADRHHGPVQEAARATLLPAPATVPAGPATPAATAPPGGAEATQAMTLPPAATEGPRASPPASGPPGQSPTPPCLTKTQQISQARRARRLARYEQVVQLHGQGVTGREIARRLKMHRGTVRRFLRADTFPERVKARRPRALDPYVEYLRQRWAEGCGRATQLLAELKDRGADCSYDMVRRCVASWRTGPSRSAGAPGVPTAGPVPHYPCPSSRRLAWMLLEPETELPPEEQAFRRELLSVCPPLKDAAELAQEFHALVSGRQADGLEAWMVKVAGRADLPDLRSFVQGLKQDEAAVRAALTLAWSNGQVEGQVNRLKMLKRQMYGRAGFDLLRRRFLLTG